MLKLVLTWQKIDCGFVLSSIDFLVCKPLAALAFQPLLRSVQYLWHDGRYSPPYDWHILLPAYATYIEPVTACFAAAFLIWNNLSLRPAMRLAQFTVLILFMRGSILRPFIYAFHHPGAPAAFHRERRSVHA